MRLFCAVRFSIMHSSASLRGLRSKPWQSVRIAVGHFVVICRNTMPAALLENRRMRARIRRLRSFMQFERYAYCKYCLTASVALAGSSETTSVKSRSFAGEVLDLRHACAVDLLIEAVDEDMADVEIARVQAADEALEEGERALVLVFLIVDQADVHINIITELGAFFDADHAAGFVFDGGVDVMDETFGLAGALQSHDNLDHRKFPLCFDNLIISVFVDNFIGLVEFVFCLYGLCQVKVGNFLSLF